MKSRSFPQLFVFLPEEIDGTCFLVIPPAVVVVLVIAHFCVFQGAVVVAPFGDVIITRSGHTRALLSDHFAAAAGAGRAGRFDVIRHLARFHIAAVDTFEPGVFHCGLLLSESNLVRFTAALTIVAGAAVKHGAAALADGADTFPGNVIQIIFHVDLSFCKRLFENFVEQLL